MYVFSVSRFTIHNEGCQHLQSKEPVGQPDINSYELGQHRLPWLQMHDAIISGHFLAKSQFKGNWQLIFSHGRHLKYALTKRKLRIFIFIFILFIHKQSFSLISAKNIHVFSHD